jgi:AAA15 family ATPase/GTPase
LNFSRLWNGVTLKLKDSNVVEALKIIEPKIKRLLPLLNQAPLANTPILIELDGLDKPVPLGSMGDGLKHLLTLSMNLINSSDGYLLVDEIDAGLHYSVMENMWRLVIETARQNNIQVFATTHSLDCIHALAWVSEQLPNREKQNISLHQLGRNDPSSVKFTADELRIAAEQHMELR